MNQNVIIKEGWENYLNSDFYDYNYGKTKFTNGGYILQVSGIYKTEEGDKFFNFEFKMISEQLKQFDNFLLLSKGLQKITRQGYIKSIKIIFKRRGNENPSKDDFREHIIWMNEKEYSHSHITNISRAIEYFTEFNKNPLKIARTRRPKKLIVDCLTEAEVNAMVRETKNLREKAMVVFLAFTGVRNDEFCNVKVNDLDLGNNQVLIRQGKFSRDRRTNFGYKCTNILIDYIIKYKKQSMDYLFTTIKNKNQYTTSDLRKFVNIISKRIKIEKRVYPHIFRHSLATNMILRGANILLVKEQLGHTDIQTTMNYIQRLPIEVIKTQYDYHAPAYI